MATNPLLQFRGIQASQTEFESYLYNWAAHIRGEQTYDAALVQAASVMHIRSRGITVSDMYSNWGTQANTQGQFLIYDTGAGDPEIHPINIVGPAVTTNKNACLQSNAAVEVTGSNQNAEHKQIAQKWQRVADFFERTTWTEAKRGFIFDAVQKEGTNLIDTFPKMIGMQNTPRVNDADGGIALFECECGQSGFMLSGDVCPACGEEVESTLIAQNDMQMGDESVGIYDIEDETIPFFNYTIDTIGAKIGGIQTAAWLEINKLRDTSFMETHYPGKTFGGPSRWSFPIQVSYALARGNWDYFNYTPANQWSPGHERYEERAIYLHESAYSNYRAPRDFEFVNPFGECTFRISEGQTIGEAQKECYGEDQHGFKYVWTEDRLLNIVAPDKEELNFRDRFSDVHFSRESGSYNSAPNYSIAVIQDDITLLNTLNHNIAARNAVNPVFYDSTVFEKNDFTNEFIGTKNAAMLPDFKIDNAITSLPVPTPSPYISQQMQWLWSIKDTVTQVTPAMRGESQRDQPFAAQRQQLEQSYGNLTSVLKSFAQCKVDTFRNKARLARKFWTLEQFQRVASMMDEVWTEDDVAEMCDIDFDRDLIISYREGSEMPSTPMSKEMKFFGALGQLGQVIAGLPPEVALAIVGQDKWQTILDRIGDFGDFDFDVAGLEADDIISQKRFISLAKACLPFEGITQDEIDAMREQVVAVQQPTPEQIDQSIQLADADNPEAMAQAQQLVAPVPITAFDTATEKLLHESGIRFNKYEDLPQAQTFFVDQYRIELGKTRPNYMLLAMVEVLLGLLEQAIAEQQQQAMEADPEYQAQRAEAERMAAAEEAKAQAEAGKAQAEQTKNDNETAKTAAQLDLDEQKLDIEREKVDLEREKVEIEGFKSDRDALIAMSDEDEVESKAKKAK